MITSMMANGLGSALIVTMKINLKQGKCMSEQVKPVDLEAKKEAELAKLDYQSLMQNADFETVKWSAGLNFDRSFGEEIERRLKVCNEFEALRSRVRELESKEASGKINKDLEKIVREEIPTICEENETLRARVRELESSHDPMCPCPNCINSNEEPQEGAKT